VLPLKPQRSFFTNPFFMTSQDSIPTAIHLMDTSPGPLELPHAQFVARLARGELHLVVNPKLAQKYIRHRLFVIGLALPLAGLGAVLALSSHPWMGLPLVAAALVVPRIIKRQAAHILLYLSTRDAKTYHEAIEYEIMEVQTAQR
jgi:hypothetical protein